MINFPWQSLDEEITEDEKKEEYIMGVDEAGRGPILGPMVYGAAWCLVKDNEKLGTIGFKDSKKLTAKTREQLFTSIQSGKRVKVAYETKIISAEEISDKMLRIAKVSLNVISHDACIDLVKSAIKKGFNITQLFVDTVGEKGSYQRKLKRIFPNIEIVVSEKADDKYPIVSAASICAKVIRDKELQFYDTELKKKEGTDQEGGEIEIEEIKEMDRSFGSGYLADQRTVDWMSRNTDKIFGFSSLVRFSWTPAQKAMLAHCSHVKWCRYGDDDDEVQADEKQTHLNFGNPRYRYFSQNDMEVVEDF
jgi:ribonuclease H2 subunit A